MWYSRAAFAFAPRGVKFYVMILECFPSLSNRAQNKERPDVLPLGRMLQVVQSPNEKRRGVGEWLALAPR